MYSPSGCLDIETFECCPAVELARVRSLALIHQSYAQGIIDDPTNESLWYAGKASGKIFAYESTNGEFDGGTPVISRGFGFGEQRLIAKNFSLDVVVGQYPGNRNHFNPLNGSNNYYAAWSSGSIMYLTEKPVSLIIGNPIVNDINKRITWRLNLKWTDRNLPIEAERNEILFSCLNFGCVGIGCMAIESTFIVG